MRGMVMSVSEHADVTVEVKELAELPWTIELRPEGSAWYARIVELPGCMTAAATSVDALSDIEGTLIDWLTVALQKGQKIPTPQANVQYSGKLFVRVSSDLHRRVSEEASRQGVSMAQWVSECLARDIGEKTARTPRAEHPYQPPSWKERMMAELRVPERAIREAGAMKLTFLTPEEYEGEAVTAEEPVTFDLPMTGRIILDMGGENEVPSEMAEAPEGSERRRPVH
jgi:antitoxin HicB